MADKPSFLKHPAGAAPDHAPRPDKTRFHMPSNFDFHRCKWLSERLEGNPVYVQKLEDWELVDLQNYADHLHGIAQKHLSDHHRLYLERGEQPVLSFGNFPEYADAERLKALVDREQTRRMDIERDRLADQVRKMREGDKRRKSGDTKPAFADLFESTDAMQKALDAARQVGIINDADRWNYGGKVGAVVAFWDFLKAEPGVIKACYTDGKHDRQATDAIAAFFGTKLSERTKGNVQGYATKLKRALKAAHK